MVMAVPLECMMLVLSVDVPELDDVLPIVLEVDVALCICGPITEAKQQNN